MKSKSLDLSKIKVFVDKNFLMPKFAMYDFFGSLENIVGKRENTAKQHFLLFQQCFQWFLSEACCIGNKMRTFKIVQS